MYTALSATSSNKTRDKLLCLSSITFIPYIFFSIQGFLSIPALLFAFLTRQDLYCFVLSVNFVSLLFSSLHLFLGSLVPYLCLCQTTEG